MSHNFIIKVRLYTHKSHISYTLKQPPSMIL